MINKEAFFEAAKPKTFTRTIDGVGDVTLKQLTKGQVDSLREYIKANPAKSFGLVLLTMSVVNDDGTLFFTNDDIKSLEDSSNHASEGLVTAALEINGFIEKDKEKNLPATQTDASVTV